MNDFFQIFYTIFSSILLFLALPNELNLLGSPLLGFLSLIPLYIVYTNLNSSKKAFFLFFLHGFLTHLLSSSWLGYFKDFAALTLGASALGTGLIEGACGILFYLPVLQTKNPLILYSTQKGAFINLQKIFFFATLYTCWEWIKSIGFLGYPWATLSSCMYKFKIFSQIADITGTYGISFLTSFFSALIGESLILFKNISKSQNPKYIIFSYFNACMLWITLSVLTFFYGLYNYTIPRKPQKILNTVMVQQNADPWKLSIDSETILLSEKLTEEQIKLAQEQDIDIDLVVWSEGCLKYNFPNSYNYYKYNPQEKPLIPFIKELQIPFILGGSVSQYKDGKRNFYNSTLLFDTDADYRGYYAKIHLVPIAEAIPFAEIPAVKSFLKNALKVSAGWTPGKQYVYFEIPCHYPKEKPEQSVKIISLKQTKKEQEKSENAVPYIKISTPICYDDSFPDVMTPLAKNGTELFVNLTDDSWSRKKSAEFQHFVVSSYRAIETRTTLARSCNSGYSVIIDPSGKIIRDMPLFKEEAIFVQIPVYKRITTIYMKFGNWLPSSFSIIFIAYSIFCFIEFQKPEIKSERKIKKSKKFKNKNKR